MEEAQPVSFGQRLLRERKIHQWTQEELADHIGASVPSIDRWEHDRRLPRKEMLEELIRVFGRPPERWGTNRWWNVPYFRNLYFTGREQILQRLQEALVFEKSGDSRAFRVISGMGGIGKTQMALEFSYRCADAFDAVLWVNAETRATMNAEFASLATVLDLPGRKHLNQFQAREAVKGWLQNHTRWLLIFDNVENVATPFTVLPRRYCGAILVTSRSQEADPHSKTLVMEKMSRAEGVAFLLRRTADDEKEECREEMLLPGERVALSQVWATMDGLPLALDQAAAYIKVARCSFHEYLDLYRKHRKDLLAERGPHTPEHPDAVATTWNLSFQRVERENPAAADVLRLCAFLAPDAIPEKLILWGQKQSTVHLQQLALSDKALKDAIKLLYSYSLLQRDSATQMLSIHRLVQAALSDAMPASVRTEWKERVLCMLNAAFPEPPFQDWVRCGQLLSHVQAYASEIEEEPGAIQLVATDLFERAGSFLREQGQYTEAEFLLLHALSLRERHMRIDECAIATSLSSLAGLYFYQDRYQRATPLVERALAIRQQWLGIEHQETAESLKHLALLYLRQEQYEQAEPLLLQSLALSEYHTGYESPTTANRMSNLALLYVGQEQYERAEPLLKQAFVINKRSMGAQHPVTARTLENLAFVYLKQGRYWRTGPLFCRALSIHAQYSGWESPDTAYPLYGLAELCRVQMNYTQSESLHQYVLTLRQNCLGEAHLDTAESLQGLADLYREWGKYEEAASLYRHALNIREKILGWESPLILKTRQLYTTMLQRMEEELQVKLTG